MSFLSPIRGRNFRAVIPRVSQSLRENYEIAKLLQDYVAADRLFKATKKSADQTDLASHKDTVDQLRQQVFDHSRLLFVTPRLRDISFQRQLVSNELVHPVTLRKLRSHRCTVAGMTKDNMSLVAGRRILSGVFRLRVKARVDGQERFYVDTFHGDIEQAKNSTPAPRESIILAKNERELSALYTLSTAFSRAAEELTGRLPSDTFYVTDSPVRKLLTRYTREEIHETYRASGGEAAVKEMVVDYLAASARDEAELDNATYIHVKQNGAIFSGVHVNDLDDWFKSDPNAPRNEIIVNYAYDPDLQQSNRAVFSERAIPTAEAWKWDRSGIQSVQSSRLAPKLLTV